MHLRFARILALFCLLMAGPLLVRAAPTVLDFFKHGEITAPAISPDGRYAAYLTPANQDDFDLNAYDFIQRESLKFDLSKQRVRGFYWLDDQQVVLMQSWRRVIFDLNKRKALYNLTAQKGDFYRVFSQIKDRPGYFYVLYYSTGRNQPEFGIINVKRSPANMSGANDSRYNQVGSLTIPGGETHNAYTDLRGEIRVISLYRDGRLQYHFRQPDDSWTELPLDPMRVEIKAFTDDPGAFYVTSRDEATGASSLHLYHAATKEMGPELFKDDTYSLDMSTVQVSRNGKELLALLYNRDRPVQLAFSPVFKQILERANVASPDRLNVITSYDADLRHFSIASFSDREIQALILETGPRGFFKLPDPHPQLPAQLMRPMKVVHFTSRDGLQLEGYLTLPDVGYGDPKPPLLVLPHDGPWQRDTWGFDRKVQFFANRGYAVFQPNYRGSVGYAKAVSLDGEFAFRKMHDDVTDGVKHVIATGAIDPERIGIFGSGFGGFLALSGVAFEPGLYRCAGSYAGIFDWKQLVAQRKEGRTYDRFAYDNMIKRLGDPEKDPALFADLSPIGHLRNVKAPVFVAHGKEDTDVDVAQSKRLVEELQKLNVPTESLFLSFVDHEIFDVASEVKLYTALELFLAKNLKHETQAAK